MNTLNSLNPTVIGIIVSVLVVLITLVFIYVFKKSRTSRRGILLTGLSGAGKTVIFAKLVYGKFFNTHTSISENKGDYSTREGNLLIVDIPGAEKLRDKFLNKYKGVAKGIIFVIDAGSFQKEIRDVAEYLYNILTDPVIADNCRHVLVFCSAKDNLMAKGSSYIKSALEKEMNTVRNTKSHQLSSTDDNDNDRAQLGPLDCDFEFSNCRYKVEFSEGDDINVEELEPLKSWLNKLL